MNTICPDTYKNDNKTIESFLMRFTENSEIVQGTTLNITTSEGGYEDIWANANVSIH